MSKSVTRIAFSVLISLAVVVGIYTSVQGARLDSRVNSAQAHPVNGLMTNLNHDRLSASELESMDIQAGLYGQSSGKGHGCNSDLSIDPSD